MEKKWKYKKEGDPTAVMKLADHLSVHPIIASLLVQRGVCTFAEAEQFFRPKASYLHNPFAMADINKAIDRISTAISHHEKILVYGDYDVDGITAVAMTYSFLKSQQAMVDFYIPDRYTEGYGISFVGIDYAVQHGVTLVIALDCGIKAVEKVCYGKSKGLDFIICDHHYPGDELPDAVAVLNPKRADCPYPFKHLSGCGVGYKLLQAYAQVHNIPSSFVESYIDMVAVSIASDVVPMIGENRVLASLGLEKLNSNPGLGMRSIMKIAGLEGKQIRVDDIVFKIGPRINAAGRMERGYYAVQLLVSDNDRAARSIASDVEEYNRNRKNVDMDITQQALRMLSNDPEYEYKQSTVLFDPTWHKGVVGIVASRIIDTYYRPTVILTESNGLATGSARSVDGFDLYKAIDACSHLLEDYGGHMFAAGVSMKVTNVGAFRERFEDVVSASISEDQKSPHIEVDADILLSDITPRFFRILQQFQPFGPDNLPPVFITRSVSLKDNVQSVGKSGEHIKMEVFHASDPSFSFQAIGFQLGDRLAEIRCGKEFDICYVAEENVFRGSSSIQFRIKDIRCSS